VVIGVRHDRLGAESVTLAAVHPDTGLVDELGRVPVTGRTRRAGIVAVTGGVTVMVNGVAAATTNGVGSTHLATYDPGAHRWVSVHRVGGDASDPLAAYGMFVQSPGDLHAVDGKLAVVGTGDIFVFDPVSGLAHEATHLNRTHCVRPNGATVWTGREWFQFGGLGTCSGDAVGVRAHAARLTMGPFAEPPSSAPSTLFVGTLAAGLALVVIVSIRRRRSGRADPQPNGL
jgi:hypothetical protein